MKQRNKIIDSIIVKWFTISTCVVYSNECCLHVLSVVAVYVIAM